MGFCVPTNVIPNWMVVGVAVLVVLVVLVGGGGSIFGSLAVKVDTIFSLPLVHEARA